MWRHALCVHVIPVCSVDVPAVSGVVSVLLYFCTEARKYRNNTTSGSIKIIFLYEVASICYVMWRYALCVHVIPVCSVDAPAVSGVVSVLPYSCTEVQKYGNNTAHGRNINGANRNNMNTQRMPPHHVTNTSNFI